MLGLSKLKIWAWKPAVLTGFLSSAEYFWTRSTEQYAKLRLRRFLPQLQIFNHSNIRHYTVWSSVVVGQIIIIKSTFTKYIFFCLMALLPKNRPWHPSFLRFLDHTQRRITVGWNHSGSVISSSQRPLPDNTHKRKTYLPSAGIEPHNLIKQTGADPRLRRRGHWDRPQKHVRSGNKDARTISYSLHQV